MTTSISQKTRRQICWGELALNEEGGNPWVTAFEIKESELG